MSGSLSPALHNIIYLSCCNNHFAKLSSNFGIHYALLLEIIIHKKRRERKEKREKREQIEEREKRREKKYKIEKREEREEKKRYHMDALLSQLIISV